MSQSAHTDEPVPFSRPRKVAVDPYCDFKSDRERRYALMVKELRLLLCHLLTTVAVVVVVVFGVPAIGVPAGVLKALLQRLPW